MNKISLLKNPVQDYAWGSTTKIQTLIGVEANGRPMAELWMGAHPKAPSRVRINGDWQPLDNVIRENPEPILGKGVAKKFAGQLPFLLKVLAAKKPLSIQVHPSLEQAQEGFARENRLGIPMDAPERNYRDGNHKPEILCALTPFQGLKGFRRIEEILRLLDSLSLTGLTHELDRLRKTPDTHGLRTFFSDLMGMDKGRQKEVAAESVRSAERLARKDPAFQWITKLDKEYPGDIGILSPVILNLVQMGPGEAIYLEAGELHAYLDGLGIELMANSDNVLRGGLTPKHIDVPELLKTVTFNAGAVRKVKSTSRNNCQTVFETPAEEFILSEISVDDGRFFTPSGHRSVAILMCHSGKATIEDLENNEDLSVSQGQSFIIPSAVSRYRIHGNATFYMAAVPQ